MRQQSLDVQAAAEQRGGSGGGLQPPWGAALLSEEERQRGVSFWGSGARVHALAHRLRNGQPVKAAFLGGSITAGSGVADTKACYASRFAQWLNATFPHRCEGLCRRLHGQDSRLQQQGGWQAAGTAPTSPPPPPRPCRDHAFENRGTPAAQSMFAAPCVDQLVPPVRATPGPAASCIQWPLLSSC